MAWVCQQGRLITTHLCPQLDKRGNLVSKDSVHTPRHGSLLLARVIHCPHTHLLACLAAVADELLALIANEHGKAHGEALARVPEVLAGELCRHADVITTEAGEMGECRTYEDGMPEAKDQAWGKERFPVIMRRDDSSHLGLEG